MLSTLPASFPSDPLLGSPFSPFQGVTPWDCSDIFSSSFKTPKPENTTSSGSGSDDPTDPKPNHDKPKPESGDPNPVPTSIVEERKRRRMISNRESARRSRMRKQKHLENLRNQVNRFRVENRELNNRLQFLLHHSNRIRTENEWLRSEQILLRRKLSNISQILLYQQLQPFSSAWPCNAVTAE